MTSGVTGVPVIAVDVAILRSAIGDAVLRPGMNLFGRVTERHGEHGLMLLNGAPVVAQLPASVEAGARLRLQVAENAGSSVLLQIVDDAAQPSSAAGAAYGPGAAAAPVVPQAVAHVPLPGGLQAQVRVEQDGSGTGAGGSGRGGGAGAVWLRLDSPQLGRLDVRVDALTCAVACSAGVPAERAREGLPELRAALARALGRPVLVTLHPRERALDVSA